MTCKSKYSFLLFLISLLFSGCSFISLNQSSASIEIKLPNASSRSAYGGSNGFTGNLDGDGKLVLGCIDEYVVTATSSSGKEITESASKDKSSILIEDIETGEWEVNFTAYALDKLDSGTIIRTIVAKNTDPVKTVVKSNEQSVVDISAVRVKYYSKNRTSPFVEGSSVSLNIQNTHQLRLTSDYILPVSQLISFTLNDEVTAIVDVSDNGFITPKHAGTCSLMYQSNQTTAGFNLDITVMPVVKVNCYVDGVNVSGKYPLYTTIVADGRDTLDNRLEDFSVYSIVKGENLGECIWYSDADCSTKVIPSDAGGLNLFGDGYSISEDLIEINIYTKTASPTPSEPSGDKEITDFDSLKAAFENGGSYVINNKTIAIAETLETSKEVSISVTGNSKIKRDNSLIEGMILVNINGKLSIIATGNGNSLSLDGSYSYEGQSTVNGKLVELKKVNEEEGDEGDDATAYFEGVTFENNKVSCNWAHPSAILMCGEVTLKNCEVKNNSIKGNCSRAPGIKIEKGANVTLENVYFEGNECTSNNFGLDIWIEDPAATVTLKGNISCPDGDGEIVSINTKGGTIGVQDFTSTSKFAITYNGIENKITDIGQPPKDTQIFSGTINPDNFILLYYDSESSSLIECPDYKLNSSGIVYMPGESE